MNDKDILFCPIIKEKCKKNCRFFYNDTCEFQLQGMVLNGIAKTVKEIRDNIFENNL